MSRIFAPARVGAASTPLAQVAQAMSVGTWQEMDGENVPVDIATFLNVGGSTNTILPYCNKAQWNPVLKCIDIIGADHNQSGGPWHVRYMEASNTFVQGPVAQPGFAGHGFDHYGVNPTTGDLYWKDYAGGALSRLTAAGSSWTQASTSFPSGISGNITYGCDWWSGSFDGVGAQGAFALWSCYSNNLYMYDPVAADWRATITGPTIGNSYHGLLNYSSVKNVAIFGGMNVDSDRVFRLNSDATWTELTASPLSWGITRGQMVADPVSGNFLLLQSGGFYELDPAGSGAWTELTGSRAKPATVNTNTLGGSGAPSIALVALPEHGVIAALSPSGGSTARMHLYKHA